MLEPRAAVDKARGYLLEIVPDFAKLDPKVEEMTRRPDAPEWTITFFVNVGKDQKAESLADLISRQRIEKVVRVAAENGELISITNPSNPY
ncbi:hypothetical protein [Terracidiphilus sp.]|jgi:hypothetical protein|uniref:hypothetical protein n=1 Tax=Terracidiphilus sp. TaxID=1964191 RepID=UPI003C186600